MRDKSRVKNTIRLSNEFYKPLRKYDSSWQKKQWKRERRELKIINNKKAEVPIIDK